MKVNNLGYATAGVKAFPEPEFSDRRGAGGGRMPDLIQPHRKELIDTAAS
jgi:hypothetical protein